MLNRFFVWLGAGVVAGGVTVGVLAGAGVAHAETGSGTDDGAKTSSQAAENTKSTTHSVHDDAGPAQQRHRLSNITTADDATPVNGHAAGAYRALANVDHGAGKRDMTRRGGPNARGSDVVMRTGALIINVVATPTQRPDRPSAVEKPRPIVTHLRQPEPPATDPVFVPTPGSPVIIPTPVLPKRSTVPLAASLLDRPAVAAPVRVRSPADVIGSLVAQATTLASRIFQPLAPRSASISTVGTSSVALGSAGPTLLATGAAGVTGVNVGHSDLTIPYGPNGYTTAADWYFPTQADGSVQPTGVIWLQHGFLGDKSWYAALATDLARQTNSVVVAPNVSSFPRLGCSGCTLNSAGLQQATATMFLGDRAALNTSAAAAGFQGTLPQTFILTGHSAGGGFATAVAGYAVDNGAAENYLLGVIMFDGVSSNGTFAPALASLDTLDIPVYQIAAPPQPWNANGQTTDELVALRPGQFIGVVLANGSHVDSLIGGVPLIDFVAQLVIRPSPPGNTAAVYTLADGWINDMYAGKGPSDPQYGLYGTPDQQIILGPATAIVLGPAPTVAVTKYLGI